MRLALVAPLTLIVASCGTMERSAQERGIDLGAADVPWNNREAYVSCIMLIYDPENKALPEKLQWATCGAGVFAATLAEDSQAIRTKRKTWCYPDETKLGGIKQPVSDPLKTAAAGVIRGYESKPSLLAGKTALSFLEALRIGLPCREPAR